MTGNAIVANAHVGMPTCLYPLLSADLYLHAILHLAPKMKAVGLLSNDLKIASSPDIYHR